MRLEHWFYTVPLRLRSLLRRDRVEQELDEELRYHLDRKIADNVSQGMSPEAARKAALRAMTGLEQRKEDCRDARGVRVIEDLRRDFRLAARVLRKSPRFTIVAMLSLGLGFGANCALFQLLDTVGLRMLPVADPEQLVLLDLADRTGWRG